MLRRHLAFSTLFVVAFFTAGVSRGEWILDPEADYEEFHGEAAVQPDGDVLLTWSRQQEPGGVWSAMAATLDPGSGQAGEAHEWGAGGTEHVVPIGTGYLAVRQHVDLNRDWVVERLDESGRRIGTSLPLGFVASAVAQATPGGGAVVVAGVLEAEGATRAWRFGSDGGLIGEPARLAEFSFEATVGADAAGNLVVAWADSGTRVFARRFSPDLQPLGPVIPVALGGARGIRVVVAPDGRFVVVYNQFSSLRVRPFTADGNPAGQRPLFSPRFDSVNQQDLSVAISPDGRILVVWKTYQNLNIPTIRARFLSLAGKPLGKVLRLARLNFGRGDLLRPRTASLPEGDFLVVWTHVDAAGETLTLRGQRFGS